MAGLAISRPVVFGDLGESEGDEEEGGEELDDPADDGAELDDEDDEEEEEEEADALTVSAALLSDAARAAAVFELSAVSASSNFLSVSPSPSSPEFSLPSPFGAELTHR